MQHPGSIIIAVICVIHIIRYGMASKMAWVGAYAALLVITLAGMAFLPGIGFYISLGGWLILLAIRLFKTPA